MALFMCLQNVMQVNGVHDVKSSVQNDASPHATNTLVIVIHVKLEIMETSVTYSVLRNVGLQNVLSQMGSVQPVNKDSMGSIVT